MDSYQIEITQPARGEIRYLPGHIRQRVLRELKSLTNDPHPHRSQEMNLEKSGAALPPGITLHRIRLDLWRIIYVIESEWQRITVLAVRKRPPYQYEDLEDLIQKL